MFNKKQIFRNFIFALFGVLILMISIILMYYVAFYDKEYEMEKSIVFNKSNTDTIQECKTSEGNYFIYTFVFKLMVAFFAGGILSDGLYIKLGVI